MPLLRRLVLVGVVLAAVLAVLAYPVAFALDAFAGGDYWLIEEKDQALVDLERSQWKAEHADGKGTDEEIAGLYGSPYSKERVLFARKDRIVKPEERPSLALLKERKAEHENVLQARTAFLLARYTAIGGASAALLGVVLLRVLRTRAAAAP